MEMLVPALLVTFGHWLTTRLEMLTWTSGNVTRPILVGPIIGLLLGDIKTGIILGGALEAVFMGVNAIGGQKPSDQNIGTCICVAFVILTGADMEAALVLAVPVATLIKNITNLLKPLKNFLAPLLQGYAAKGDRRKFEFVNWLGEFGLFSIDTSIILFLCILFGVNSLDAVMAALPAFVLTGLNTAGNVLVAVGLGLTLSMIWSKELGMFFFIGFLFSKAVGMSQIQIAVLGASIAVIYYFITISIDKAAKTGSADSADEEDIFA